MYIHSYQIHNVLNVYRKQLSQETAQTISGRASEKHSARDRINISMNGQRQSLFNKISSEIVERITRFGPDTEFQSVLAGQTAETDRADTCTADGTAERDAAFTYTLIDERNQKSTQRLPVRQLSLPTDNMESATGTHKESDTNSDTE